MKHLVVIWLLQRAVILWNSQEIIKTRFLSSSKQQVIFFLLYFHIILIRRGAFTHSFPTSLYLTEPFFILSNNYDTVLWLQFEIENSCEEWLLLGVIILYWQGVLFHNILTMELYFKFYDLKDKIVYRNLTNFFRKTVFFWVSIATTISRLHI